MREKWKERNQSYHREIVERLIVNDRPELVDVIDDAHSLLAEEEDPLKDPPHAASSIPGLAPAGARASSHRDRKLETAGSRRGRTIGQMQAFEGSNSHAGKDIKYL